MADTMALTLLRHGLTAENERSAYIGWIDSPLSTRGRNNLTGKQVGVESVDLLFSSDLKRCLETSAILFPDVPVHKRKNLREMNFGAWEGRTYEALKHITTYRQWLDDPFSYAPDEGESFSEFRERVLSAFASLKTEILEKWARETVIITHGGVIRQWLSTFFGYSFFSWKIPYGGGYRLTGTRDCLRRNEGCMSLQEVPITGKQHG